jgi:hypothetical protein
MWRCHQHVSPPFRQWHGICGLRIECHWGNMSNLCADSSPDPFDTFACECRSLGLLLCLPPAGHACPINEGGSPLISRTTFGRPGDRRAPKAKYVSGSSSNLRFDWNLLFDTRGFESRGFHIHVLKRVI